MNTAVSIQNCVEGETINVLQDIHQDDINIAIYDREMTFLQSEIEYVVKQEIAFRAKGNIATILSDLSKALKDCALLQKDIEQLLHTFQKVTSKDKFRLLLATINNNMCRKFHTDVNALRLLCTYSGQGTLWLTEDNINVKALKNYKSEESIALNESEIRQAATGSVIILKGAIYPGQGTKAVVHRSPTIEENGENRLLLRIDTEDFLSFQ
ncbi:MAG: DUF1826 domain-containing protein [Bacteroidota bacterium]